MKLVSPGMAAKEEFAPNKTFLYRQAKKSILKDFYVKTDDGKVLIDIESEAWIKFLENRKINHLAGTQPGGDSKKTKTSPEAKAKINNKTVTRKSVAPEEDISKEGFNSALSLYGSDDTKKTQKQLEEELAKARLIEKKRDIDFKARSTEAKVKKEELSVIKMQKDIDSKNIDIMVKSKTLIEFDVAEFYFFAYMDSTSSALLNLVKKLGPKIENLCMQRKYVDLKKLLQTEIENTIQENKLLQCKAIEEFKDGD